MPQPLSRVATDAQINISAGALSTCNPIFPQLIMHVIASWSHIDGDLATIFSHMLKADIAVGTALYQSFQGAKARENAFRAAAAHALPRWQQVAVEAVWRGTAQSRLQRHKFAHHVWGTCEKLPDALLLMDPKVVVDRNVSLRQRTQELPDGRGVIAPKDVDRSKIYVYRIDDFRTAQGAAHTARLLYVFLTMTVGEMAIEVGRRQLLSAEQFQAAVAPLLRNESDEVRCQLAPPGDGPPAPGIWKDWDARLGRL